MHYLSNYRFRITVFRTPGFWYSTLFHFSMKKLLLVVLVSSFVLTSFAQDRDGVVLPDPEKHTYKPLTLNLNDKGTKYLRFLLWGQFWLRGQENAQNDFFVNASVRRARILALAQVSPRFMFLIHFGLNNLNDATMDPLGIGALGPQLFLHDAWSEYLVVPEHLSVGIGLHYWNGISRLTNQSTLNFMTLDNYRRAWATLGLSDQFARHLGVYAKGMIGQFAYRISVNSSLINSLDTRPERLGVVSFGQTLYTGKYEFQDDARWLYQGYLEYQFLEKEPDKLPYKVGTYLGQKRVFNIGVGAFYHPNGSITYRQSESNPGDTVKAQNDVSHIAVDLFYDSPIGKGAITAYAVYYMFDYGPNYTFTGLTYGTGGSILIQGGYLLPKFSEVFRLQPYVAFNTTRFEAYENGGNSVRAGLNFFLNGHHSKFTLEYETRNNDYTGFKPDAINTITLQAQIFL
ncbi:MAG TPA: porin [Flavobacteriales bacterium]|jgi:hypothetical protein|nr:porin [Flavobacteriales bacterium]